MLRISPQAKTASRVELRLAGQIGSEEAALLADELQCLWRDGIHIVLDLEGIEFIDRVGLALLSQWVAKGLELRGGSRFIQRMLRTSTAKGSD